MGEGLVTSIMHPSQFVEGLSYAFSHPGEAAKTIFLGDAEEDWENGDYGEAIGDVVTNIPANRSSRCPLTAPASTMAAAAAPWSLIVTHQDHRAAAPRYRQPPPAQITIYDCRTSSVEHTIAAIRERLLDSDIAREDELAGCSEDELTEIRAINPGVVIPELYLAFMREMGRRTGYLLAGTDIRYPEYVEYQDDVREFAGEDPSFHPDEWFVFALHQGYQFYYFRDGDPRVYVHSEGENNPFIEYTSFEDLIDSLITEALPHIAGHRAERSKIT